MFKSITFASVLAALVWGGSVSAQTSAPSTVEWVVPALPSARPQTPDEQSTARTSGRALPTPEVLQPGLDAALPAYQPRKDIKLSGSFKGAASDVLPPLVNRWIGAFRKYYPDVNIDVAPPYAGSLGAIELVKEKLDFVFVSDRKSVV